MRHFLLADTTPVSQGGLGNLQKSLANVGEAGYGSKVAPPLPLLVGQIISQILALLGVLFLALTVYAGYRWMMARGNEQEVEKAKETLKTGVIGMGIMLGAYAISNLVVNNLVNQTLGG